MTGDYYLLARQLSGDPARLEALLYESQRLILAALMVALALVRLYSSVAFMLLLLAPTLVRSVITERVCGVTSGQSRGHLRVVAGSLQVRCQWRHVRSAAGVTSHQWGLREVYGVQA